MHDRDAVAKPTNLADGVADDERRERPILMKVGDDVKNCAAHRDVDARGRVIRNEQMGFEDERLGDRDPLPLSPAQFVWIRVHGGERKPHRVDDGRDGDPRLELVEVRVARVDGFGDVLSHGQPSIEGRSGVLRHVADSQ